MSKVRINIPPAGGGGGKKKAAGESDLAKGDVILGKRIDRGRDTFGEDQPGFGDSDARPEDLDGNPHLAAAVAFLEGLLDPNKPFDKNAMAKVIYYLHHYYHVNYVSRLCMEIILKVLQWPYVSRFVMQRLTTQLDIHMLTETFPKLIRIHSSSNPKMLGYTIAVMGCVADLDARHFSALGGHGQLYFHVIQAAQKMYKSDAVMLNTLLFLQRLCAPSSVDFFLTRTQKAALVKLGGNRVGMPLSGDSGLGKTVSVPPELDVTARGEMTAHDRKVQMLSSTGYADEMLAQYLVSTQTAGDIFLGKVQYYSYTKNEHDYDARCVTTLHQTQRYPSEKLVGKQLGAKYKVSRMPRANMKSMMPGGKLPTDVTPSGSVTPVSSNGGGGLYFEGGEDEDGFHTPPRKSPPPRNKKLPPVEQGSAGGKGGKNSKTPGGKKENKSPGVGGKKDQTPQGKTPGTTAAGTKNGKTPGKKPGAAASPLGHNLNDHDPLPEDAPPIPREDGVVGLDTDEAVPSELAQIQDDRERKRWLDKQQTLEYCDFYTRIRDCHLKNQVELFSSGALEWLLQLLQQLAVPPIYHRAPKSLKTKEEEAEDKQRLAEKKAREEAERKAAEEEERQRKEEEEANAKRAEEALAAATAAANLNRDREKMGSGEKAKTGSRGGSGAAGGSAGRKTRSRSPSPGAHGSGGSAGRNKSPAAAEGFIENGIGTTTGLPVVVQAGGAESGKPHLTSPEGAPGQAQADEPAGKPSSRPASAANKSRPSSRTQSASRKNSTMEDAAAGVGAASVGEAGQVLKVDDVVLDDARRSSVNSIATAPAAMENAAPSAAAGSRPQSRSGTPQKTRTPELQRRASAPATLEEQAKTPPRSGGGSRPGTPGFRGSTVASKPEIGLMPLDEEGHEVAAAAPPAAELEQSQAGVEHQERPGSGKNPTTYARAATTPIPGAERPEQGTLSLDAISAQVAASGVEPPFAGPNVTEPASQAQQVQQPTLLQESGAHLGDQPSIPLGDQHQDLPDKSKPSTTRSAAAPAKKQAKPKKQSKKELAAQAELRRLEAERKKQEELRQIRLGEMEKEGREADVLLLGLHSLYLLVRENPHTLRRLCRSEIWEHISDGQKDHSSSGGASKKDHHSLEDQNVVPVGLGGPGTSGPDGVTLKPPGDNSSLPTGAPGNKKKKKNRGDQAADNNEDDDWRKLPPAELFERAKRKKLSQITQIDEIQKSCILTFSKLLKGRYAQDRADIILLLFRVIKLCALYWSKDPEVGPWLELVGPVQEALGWFSDNMFVQIEGAQALSGILKMSRVNSGGPAKEGATKLEGVSKHKDKGPAPADGGGEPGAGEKEKQKDIDKENTSKPKEEANPNPRNEKEFLGLRVPVLRNLSERIKDGIVNTKTILEVQERMGAGEMAEVLQCFSPRLLELAQKAKDACDEMMIEALQEKKKLDEKLAIALEKAEAKRLKEEEERLAAEAEKEKERAEKEAEATKKKKAEEGEAAGENAAAAGEAEGGEQPTTEKKDGEQPQADGTAAANNDAAVAADAGGAAPDGAEKKETDAATEKNPADQENGENNLPENGEQENKGEEEENNEEQPAEDFGVDLEGNPVTEHLDPVTQAKIALRAASEFQGKLGDPSLVGNTQIQLFEPSVLKSVKPITETAGSDPIVRPRKVTRKGMKFRLYYRAGADENVASMLKMFEGDANRLRCQKLYASAVNGLGYELPGQGLTLGLRCVQFQPDQENLDAISGSDAVFSEEEGRGALKRAANYEAMMAQMEARVEAGERRAMLAKLSGAVDVETGDMDLLDAQAEQGQYERDRLNSAEGRGLKRVTKGGGNYLPVMAPSGSGSGFFE